MPDSSTNYPILPTSAKEQTPACIHSSHVLDDSQSTLTTTDPLVNVPEYSSISSDVVDKGSYVVRFSQMTADIEAMQPGDLVKLGSENSNGSIYMGCRDSNQMKKSKVVPEDLEPGTVIAKLCKKEIINGDCKNGVPRMSRGDWIRHAHDAMWTRRSVTSLASKPHRRRRNSLFSRIREGWRSELSFPEDAKEAQAYCHWRVQPEFIMMIRITLFMLALAEIIHVPLDIATYCHSENDQKSPSLCLDSENGNIVLILRVTVICIPAVLAVLGSFLVIFKDRLTWMHNYVFGCLLLQCIGVM
ncbi:hypothetical protein HDU76_002942 [Blyttiomyces sp. JEL0837]|nr:hypothetical protein HDU76_002942 [Blyttiomyces sp. JEL0837]